LVVAVTAMTVTKGEAMAVVVEETENWTLR
jgi:hypothetical protein